MKYRFPWRGARAYSLLAALLCIAFFAPARAADAAAASDVSIPWGAWMASTLPSLGSAVAAWLAWIIGKWAPPYVKSLVTEAVITKAVNYGLAAVEGAVAGKSLDVKTTNSVIVAALHYAVRVEPAAAKWAGGNLAPMILAKLSELGVVPPEASSSTTGIAVNAK